MWLSHGNWMLGGTSSFHLPQVGNKILVQGLILLFLGPLIVEEHIEMLQTQLVSMLRVLVHVGVLDNFRMHTGYGRYGAAYNMVALICLNDKLFVCLSRTFVVAKESNRGKATSYEYTR
jgi:hypothetical protein